MAEASPGGEPTAPQLAHLGLHHAHPPLKFSALQGAVAHAVPPLEHPVAFSHELAANCYRASWLRDRRPLSRAQLDGGGTFELGNAIAEHDRQRAPS